MAVIDLCSFEWLTTATLAHFWNGTDFALGTGTTIVTSLPSGSMRGAHVRAFGGPCSSAGWTFRNIAGAKTVVTFVLAFNITSSAGTGPCNVIEVHVANNPNHNTVAPFRVYFTDNAGLADPPLNANINGADIGTSVNVTRQAWHVLEFRVEISATPTVYAKLDGVQFASSTADTSGLGAIIGAYGLNLFATGGGTGPNVWYTDVVVFDDEAPGMTRFLYFSDDPVVAGVLPDADGAHAEWVPNSGSVHYDRVNEVPADDNTSYNADNGQNTADTYGLPAVALTNRSVLATMLTQRLGSTSGAPVVQALYRLDGVDYAGQSYTPGSYYNGYEVLEASPASGIPWRGSEINALEVGIKRTSATGIARVSQVVLEVASSASVTYEDFGLALPFKPVLGGTNAATWNETDRGITVAVSVDGEDDLMALGDAYATAAEYRAVTGATDTASDAAILVDLTAVSRYVEGKLKRFFNKNTGDTTRLYIVPATSPTLLIDDLSAAPTSIKVSSSVSLAFADITALVATAYDLAPINALAQPEPWPYSRIELTGGYFYAGQRVQIVGKFGWPLVPVAIKQATIQIAAILRLETPRATRRIAELGETIEASHEAQNIVGQLMQQYAKWVLA